MKINRKFRFSKLKLKYQIIQMSYYTPKVNRSLKEAENTQPGYTRTLKKESSVKNINELRNSMNEIINQVNAKRQNSKNAIIEVVETNKMIIDVLSGSYKNNGGIQTQLSIDSPINRSVYPETNGIRSGRSNLSDKQYIQALENENRQLKRRLNEQIGKNSALMSRMMQSGISFSKRPVVSRYEEQSDIAGEKRAWMHQAPKDGDDLSRLYYQLQVLKKNNNQIRKDTVKLLSKKH